jgi:hypothetical protein
MEEFYTSTRGDGDRELDSRKQRLSMASSAHRIAASTMLPSGSRNSRAGSSLGLRANAGVQIGTTRRGAPVDGQRAYEVLAFDQFHQGAIFHAVGLRNVGLVLRPTECASIGKLPLRPTGLLRVWQDAER